MTNNLNGIDVATLQQFAQGVAEDANKRHASFNVKTAWKGQTRSVAKVSRYSLAGETYSRDFEIVADEPNELLGENTAPNPQELLMAALNACMSVGYAANAAMMGIKIHSTEIETDGTLDLRGFTGIDESVNQATTKSVLSFACTPTPRVSVWKSCTTWCSRLRSTTQTSPEPFAWCQPSKCARADPKPCHIRALRAPAVCLPVPPSMKSG